MTITTTYEFDEEVSRGPGIRLRLTVNGTAMSFSGILANSEGPGRGRYPVLWTPEGGATRIRGLAAAHRHTIERSTRQIIGDIERGSKYGLGRYPGRRLVVLSPQGQTIYLPVRIESAEILDPGEGS